MDDKFDGIVLTLFGHNIEFQQSIINWLILCVLFSIFFIWAGKKFEKADVRKAPSGILLITEMITGLCTNIIGDNLKHETKHYLSFLGTLTMMMAVLNRTQYPHSTYSKRQRCSNKSMCKLWITSIASASFHPITKHGNPMIKIDNFANHGAYDHANNHQ